MSTRRRRRSAYRSQMPRDPAERARIERIDADRKNRHRELHHEIAVKRAVEATEQAARREADARIADIISQGDKAPKTWNEINSSGAGGSTHT